MTPPRTAALPAGVIGCPLPRAGTSQRLNARTATPGHTARGIPTQAASLPRPEHQSRRWLPPHLKVRFGFFGLLLYDLE